MLVDDSLWLQFRQAKTSLFGALLDRHQPPLAHVLSAPPPLRHTMRTETDKLVSSLLEVERELKAFQRESKQILQSVSQQRAAAEMSLRPVGMLPSEVIREIVLHAVTGTHAHHQILYLTQVSRFWRQVVTGFSALFTEADWNKWPVQLVDTWCSRAGSRLLKVYLQKCDRLHPASKRSLAPLLRERSIQVSRLKVAGGESVNHHTKDLFRLYMPSLEYLDVRKTESNFHIQAENMPTLRVLELMLVKPRIPTPLTSVIGFRYDPVSVDALWDHGRDVLSQLPNLQHLALGININHGRGSSMHCIDLPRLISLEVRWITRPPIDKVLLFFETFWLPSLQSLVLHDTFFDYESYPILLKSLVRA
jgi:hypothetical protein